MHPPVFVRLLVPASLPGDNADRHRGQQQLSHLFLLPRFANLLHPERPLQRLKHLLLLRQTGRHPPKQPPVPFAARRFMDSFSVKQLHGEVDKVSHCSEYYTYGSLGVGQTVGGYRVNGSAHLHPCGEVMKSYAAGTNGLPRHGVPYRRAGRNSAAQQRQLDSAFQPQLPLQAARSVPDGPVGRRHVPPVRQLLHGSSNKHKVRTGGFGRNHSGQLPSGDAEQPADTGPVQQVAGHKRDGHSGHNQPPDGLHSLRLGYPFRHLGLLLLFLHVYICFSWRK